MNEQPPGLPPGAALRKRAFDLILGCIGIMTVGWLIPPAALLAWLDTGESGFFTQKRAGRFGGTFRILKIRTMKSSKDITTSVTSADDHRITPLGRFLRNTDLDELPQLINVLRGDMSFVGPRPDVPEFYERLSDADRVIFSIRPGITGPATLKFYNEEALLAEAENPEKYNREVIYPEKVRMNKKYIEEYSLLNDIGYVFQTLKMLSAGLLRLGKRILKGCRAGAS